MRPLEGLFTAMVTPFRADGRVNEEGAVALGRHLLANGSSGLVVNSDGRFIKYDPRGRSSYCACTVSTLPRVSGRTLFSMTTTSLGRVTAK